jgi:hypothetical protein
MLSLLLCSAAASIAPPWRAASLSYAVVGIAVVVPAARGLPAGAAVY